MKKILTKLYILGLMVATLFCMQIIWKLTFGHLFDDPRFKKEVGAIAKMIGKDDLPKGSDAFKEAILDSEETIKHYLGYRVLEEKRIEGHFHHIAFDFKPDERSYCITCHGDMPHGKVKELRAFGNMHASYIACQTCHVRLDASEKTGIYKWYDRQTGEIVPSPVKEGVLPGSYTSKIIPFVRVDGQVQRIDTPELIAFAERYRQTESTLNDIQKSKAKKMIHKIVDPKPYMCEACHQAGDPILPFRELGYPQNRVDAIVSTEVVGMIKNYTQFYMPRMLHPGESEG